MDHHHILEVAAAQYGVFTRAQAAAHGVTRSALRNRLATGSWERVSSTVFRVAGTPPSPEQQAMTAALDVAGGVVSHESSAAIWQLPGFRLTPIHVVRELTPTQTPSALSTVHSSTHLPPGHRCVQYGIPVTTPARTLFDLASRVHPLGLPRLVDAAWSMRLVTGRALHAALEDHAERGRPGIQLMREILTDRPADHRPPDSNLEARFQEIAHSIGLTSLRRQVDLGGDVWVGRVDFVDDRQPLVVEVDSERFHGSLSDQQADEARRQALIDAGFVVLRIAEFDIWHRPAVVRDQLRAAFR